MRFLILTTALAVLLLTSTACERHPARDKDKSDQPDQPAH